MTHAAASPRFVGAFGALALSISVLAACAPTPEPTPTPTALFASDEEAFAAAEETYRAYNDAGNARLSGEPTPNPQDFLVGAALEGDIDGQRDLDDAGIHVEGDIRVAEFAPSLADSVTKYSRLTATICLDLSNTRVVDDTGNPVDLPERPDIVAQQAEFIWIDGSYRISDELEGEVSECDG